jgi:putative transcriptional regulator
VTDFPESLRGQLLMAMPSLLDPNFYQTVVCLSEHTREGAVGIVINRTHPTLKAETIFNELDMPHRTDVGEASIFLGGPVHISEVFILHGPPYDVSTSLEIRPWLAMSTTREILERIARGEGPRPFMISLGCAGWGPGQLEAEIQQNAWLTCDSDEKILFEVAVDQRWEYAMRKLGIDPSRLTDAAGHA